MYTIFQNGWMFGETNEFLFLRFGIIQSKQPFINSCLGFQASIIMFRDLQKLWYNKFLIASWRDSDALWNSKNQSNKGISPFYAVKEKPQKYLLGETAYLQGPLYEPLNMGLKSIHVGRNYDIQKSSQSQLSIVDLHTSL